MRRLMLLAALGGLACTAAELDEQSERGALGRPVEDCADGACGQTPGGGVERVVAEVVDEARADSERAGELATDELPTAPTVRLPMDEQSPAALLQAELDALPRGEAPRSALLLRLAWAHRNADDKPAMNQAMLELIRDHPLAEEVPLAYVTIAEYYFDEGSYANAGKLYDKAAQFYTGPAKVAVMGAYVEYMRGWCSMLTDPPEHHADALQTFYRSLQRLRDGTSASEAGVSRQALLDGALLAVPAAYLRVGRPGRFVAFVERFAADDLPQLTTLLGKAYERNGMTAESESLCEVWRKHDVGAECSWR